MVQTKVYQLMQSSPKYKALAIETGMDVRGSYDVLKTAIYEGRPRFTI